MGLRSTDKHTMRKAALKNNRLSLVVFEYICADVSRIIPHFQLVVTLPVNTAIALLHGKLARLLSAGMTNWLRSKNENTPRSCLVG